MFTPKTFTELCHAMQTRAEVALSEQHGDKEHFGVINSIKAEDGSGRNWIVTVQPQVPAGKDSRQVYKHAVDVFFRDPI